MANPAGVQLAGLDPDPFRGDAEVLTGVPFGQLVTGPDGDAGLLQPDGSRRRVRVVRWPLPVTGRSVALLIELDRPLPNADTALEDVAWTAELERMLRVGRWSYDLRTGRLQRGDSLVELYRSVGIDPDGPDNGALEHDQIALLGQALGYPGGPRQHHTELTLSDARTLSCRAEVVTDAGGSPTRIVGVVRDLSAAPDGPAPDDDPAGQLVRSGPRFADLMAMVPGGVALVDRGGRILDANPGLCALLDLAPADLRGRAVAGICADSDGPYPDALGPLGPGPAAIPDWLRPVPPGQQHGYRVGDVALRRRDGTAVWCELAVSTASIGDGGVGDGGAGWCWLVLCTDVSERRRATELLRRAGSVDELTRLPNRAAVVTLVDRLLAGPEPGSGRRGVRRHRRLPAGELLAGTRGRRRPAGDAGRAVAARAAGRLHRGPAVR